MIGANGSGKTSLLDVFSLLSASAQGDLGRTIGELGGIEANLSNLKQQTSLIEFGLIGEVAGQASLEYRMAITPRGAGYEIAEETLNQQQASGRPPLKHLESRHGNVRYFMPATDRMESPSWEYNPGESALSQVPRMFQAPEEFRRRLASVTHYHALDVTRRAPVRLPQPLRAAQLPGANGEDLVSCLYNLRETAPDHFATIEDTLRAGFPGFEQLGFPPVAAGTLAMTWKESTSRQPFYMHQLSEGALRFLWLVTLLQSPGLTAITLIDEPEVSLHPELLSLLAEILREASERTQLIVATHADRLVRFLKPEEVATLTVNDEGAVGLVWADELDLGQWLEEYTLDEVWRLGRMGGRP